MQSDAVRVAKRPGKVVVNILKRRSSRSQMNNAASVIVAFRPGSPVKTEPGVIFLKVDQEI